MTLVAFIRTAIARLSIWKILSTVLKNSISEKTYDEWQEYCLWAKDFEQVVPNLKSWCMGCPRVDEATQEKLTAMRNELNELIKETKAKFELTYGTTMET